MKKRDFSIQQVKAAVSVSEASNVEERTMRVVASTETPDRYGDIVRAAGWNLANFEKNPVALWQHDHTKPIGTVKAWVEGEQLLSEITFAPEGTTQVSDDAFKLYEAGILKAVSVGFQPIDEPIPLDKAAGMWGPLEFPTSELLELSLVSVPANQEALAVAKSLDISDEGMKRFFVPEDAGDTAKPELIKAKNDLRKLSIPR